jgi:hemolysin III
MLVVVWGLAVLGIAFKALFIHRFQVLSTLAYVGMGWLCVVAWNEMVTNLPPQSLTLLAAGGASYTIGVIFYAWHKMPYNHAVWHLFVIGGSVCHYFSILPLVG